MRFAYIDSKGKEIELDSVEALALRIELGAISDETKLYDSSQDRWAPAKEHPIFQSLSSGKPVGDASEATAAAPEPDAGGGPPKPKKKAGGPPKPKKKAKAPPAEQEAPAEEEAPEEPEIPEAASAFMGPEVEGAKAEVHEPEPSGDVEPVSFADVMEDEEEAPVAEAEPEPGAAAESEPEAETAEEAASFETEGPLELEEVEEAPPEPGTEEEAAGDDVLDMDLDLVEGPEEAEAEPEPAGAPAAEPGEEAPSFEMEGPLELEEDEASPTVPGTEEPEPEAAETPAGGGAGMELEGALDWAGLDEQEGAETDEAAAGAKPGREKAEMFGPEDPPPGDGDEPDAGEGLELEPAHAAAAAEPEASAEEEAQEGGAKSKRKRPSAPRPSHWEDRNIGEGSGGVGKLLVGLVLVAALGAGGWYFLMGPGASREAVDTGPDLPPAPGLQPELVPTMNEMAGPAMAALVERTDSLWSQRGALEAPGQSWLTGAYFASASEYGYIEQYWEAIQSFVADLQEEDDALFRETLETRLQEAVEAGEVELSEAEMAAILDRAEWEFMAATAQADPYASLDSLAGAALDLHALLLSRESDILTEDEAGGFGTADPILEVIVQDETLRSAMNDRLDEVLRTVAEAEAPAPVTTHGLMASLYEKIRAAAFP